MEYFDSQKSQDSLKDQALGRTNLQQILKTNLNQETGMPPGFSYQLGCLHLSAHNTTTITTTATTTAAATTSNNEHLYSAYCVHLSDPSTLHLLTDLILSTIPFYG